MDAVGRGIVVEAGDIAFLPCPTQAPFPFFFVRIKDWGIGSETNLVQVHPVASHVAALHTVIPYL